MVILARLSEKEISECLYMSEPKSRKQRWRFVAIPVTNLAGVRPCLKP